MQQEEKDRRRKRMSTVYYIFGIFMVLFYVGMAYVMIFSPIFVKSISAQSVIAWGCSSFCTAFSEDTVR